MVGCRRVFYGVVDEHDRPKGASAGGRAVGGGSELPIPPDLFEHKQVGDEVIVYDTSQTFMGGGESPSFRRTSRLSLRDQVDSFTVGGMVTFVRSHEDLGGVFC